MHPRARSILLAVIPLAALVAPAAAQRTTGSIEGRVTDRATGDPLPGTTIVLTFGNVTQTAIAEEDGSYRFTSLIPGEYLVTFFIGDTEVNRRIRVSANRTVPLFQALDLTGTIVYLEAPPPDIEFDPAIRTTIDGDLLDSTPVPGRGFEAALGITPGSQSDGFGTAFSGSTAAESQYFIDGVSTTGLRYGTQGSTVINNFIDEIEVLTGGYNAEYGRATGAVVNVVTVTGDNTTRGEIFATARPGFLVAQRREAPREGASIDITANLAFAGDGGAWVAGPVIKDKLWYAVGAAPTYTSTTITRSTKRRMDCRRKLASGEMSDCDGRTLADGGNADGFADVDPATGFTMFEPLGSRDLSTTSAGVFGFAKLNYAYRPEHQGQLSINALGSQEYNPELFGLPSAGDYDARNLTTDTAFRWTSKFGDGATELEATLGWHREHARLDPRGAAADRTPYEVLLYGQLGTWAQLGYEDSDTFSGCRDGDDADPYDLISNCPDELGHGYRVGGFGPVIDNRANRYSARLGGTHRFDALGGHVVKAGVDLEDNRLSEPRAYTGGAYYENYQNASTIFRTRWIQAGQVGTTDPRFDQICPHRPAGSTNDVDQPCRYIGQTGEGSMIEGETLNWSAYLRDSWRIRPNLSLDAGIRYEEQRLRFARYLRDEMDPVSGRPYGANAMKLDQMWAPRVGLVYDWTRDGRSKLYGHWGRFYESIPMDINARSFAGEVSYRQAYNANACGGMVDGYGSQSGMNCPQTGSGGADILGINGSLVAPGIKPQYMDEAILGVEFEIMEDLKLGIGYQNRTLGRVIEDVSTDGAATYVIANPGELDRDEEARLEQRLAATMDPAERADLERVLRQLRGIRSFDKPSRRYDALQFTAARRFSKAMYLQASYTYSRTKGNFPGLISYDNGQLDPNISSQYDLIELLANRNGPLPQDRPHYIKLDGFYRFDLKREGTLTTGVRARALSGVPRDVLGRHDLYGPGESFLLPRGQIGRTQFDTGLDLHVGFKRPLKHGMELEIFADVFNVLDRQGTFSVEEQYTTQSASNPIVGGTYEDLIFAKANDRDDGSETSETVIRNPNFGNVSARYAPLSTQLGARLRF